MATDKNLIYHDTSVRPIMWDELSKQARAAWLVLSLRFLCTFGFAAMSLRRR